MSGWHNDKPEKKQYPCDAENCDKVIQRAYDAILIDSNRYESSLRNDIWRDVSHFEWKL